MRRGRRPPSWMRRFGAPVASVGPCIPTY
jgi:hypothetical protein